MTIKKIDNYTITIGTYVHRFEEYFKPLMTDICRNRPDIEKIVFVNGQHGEKFHQDYRKNILSFLSNFENTYVYMSPCFRGCSYIWNTTINMASEENILFIADDCSIEDGFFEDYENVLGQENVGSFSIGPFFTYGHFSVTREDIKNVGHFDERLLAIGEEDGEWDLRYSEFYNIPDNAGRPGQERYGFSLPHHHTNKIKHINENTETTSQNIQKGTAKYSAFNKQIAFSTIINEDMATHDPNKYTRQGPYGCPVQRREDEFYGKSLYPGQLFFWENKQYI